MPNAPDLKIKIDGTPLKDELDDILEVVVNLDRYLPGMFTILVHDQPIEQTGKPMYVDSAKFDLGKAVEIVMQAGETEPDRSGPSGTLIKGEITSIEPSFSSDRGANLIVRGYDRSHRLHRGTFTRTFLKVKDSDIAGKIAGEAGLSHATDATTETYDYVMQYNQTNWEFLRARAERIGYHLYVDDKLLCFKKAERKVSGPTFEWGVDLKRFEPRLSGTQQVDKATVKGWDVTKKQAIVGNAASSGIMPGGFGKSGGTAAKSAFSAATTIVVDAPVSTSGDANTAAQAVLDQTASEFIQADGVCFGDPRILPGVEITVKGVGKRFSGKYLVTAATHIFSRGGYETRFTIGSREENTLRNLLDRAGTAANQRGDVPGVVVGLVTNNKDPDKLGRVKVKFPWLSDQDESNWARIAAPMAGKQRGFFYLPEVDDEVLVAFEHDDINYPYIVGGLWNGKDAPPETNDDGKNNKRVIKSRSGHLIILNDEDGKEQIVIRDKTGKNEIVIDSKENSMSIKVDKDFSIEAKGNVTVKTSGGDMTLECNNYNVKAKAKVAVEGQGGVEMKTSAQMKIEGSITEIKASGTGKFDGGGMLELKGGLVKIN
jgi:phage protein D/phage baseplate assembly protein gpV